MYSLEEIIKQNNPYSYKEKIKEQNKRNARAEVKLKRLTSKEKEIFEESFGGR